MSNAIAILAILAAGPPPDAIEARCGWVELNHFCELRQDADTGVIACREILCQVIFWRGGHRDECLAWRMAERVTIRPEPSGVVVSFEDGDRRHVVRGKFLLETWTDFDPEQLNREIVPTDQRRGLGMGNEVRVPPRLRWKVVP